MKPKIYKLGQSYRIANLSAVFFVLLTITIISYVFLQSSVSFFTFKNFLPFLIITVCILFVIFQFTKTSKSLGSLVVEVSDKEIRYSQNGSQTVTDLNGITDLKLVLDKPLLNQSGKKNQEETSLMRLYSEDALKVEIPIGDSMYYRGISAFNIFDSFIFRSEVYKLRDEIIRKLKLKPQNSNEENVREYYSVKETGLVNN